MTDVNTWPTGAEIPVTTHTEAVTGRPSLARPEINKGIVAQRKMATVLNASNLSDGDILAYNAGTRRFEPSRTSNIQRYVDHPLPTRAQLRYVAGATYFSQRDIAPDYRAGATQRYRFRSGVLTAATSITQAVANNNVHYVNVGLPTNFAPGNTLTLLLQNVSHAQNTQTPVRVSWASAFHFQSAPGFTFVSGKIHEIPKNETWQFRLVKITNDTILVTRISIFYGVAL